MIYPYTLGAGISVSSKASLYDLKNVSQKYAAKGWAWLNNADIVALSKNKVPTIYSIKKTAFENGEKENKFIGSHNIDNAIDYCIINDTEYILTSDNKVKRWGIINSETEEEGWIPIETFNCIGNKLVVSGTKIIFVYLDSYDYQSVNSGLAILETTTNILTKLPLWITASSWFLEPTHTIMICNGYLTFGNNTAIPLNNLVAEALLTTTMQARAYCLGKYWSTDNMNAFISDTIDGEYSQTLTGLVERPSSYLALSETELFIHCNHFNSSKNYVYDGTNLTEKTATRMDEIYYNRGYIFGFYGWEHKVIYSSDKGTTWQEQDLGVEVKSIGCAVDTASITVTTANALYFRVYDLKCFIKEYNFDGDVFEIEYYKASDNSLICLNTQNTNLNKLFQYTGFVPYYVLDTELETITLIRVKNNVMMYVGDNFVETSFTDDAFERNVYLSEIDRNIYTQIVDKTITSNTATSMLSTGIKNTILKENFLKKGTNIHLSCKGLISGLNGENVTIKIMLGSTTLIEKTTTLPTLLTDVVFDIELDMLCTVSGSEGKVVAFGGTLMYAGQAIVSLTGRPLNTVNDVTIDTTIAQKIDIFYNFGSENAGNALLIKFLKIDY